MIAEVPSVLSEEEDVEVSRICGAYALLLNFNMKGSNLNSLCAHLRLLTSTCKQLVEEAYKLERKKLMEILAFVLSDTDCMHDPQYPNQVCVAYGLKGYSLTTDVLQEMIEEVRNKCHEHGIQIIADCMDGQWSKIPLCDKEGQPLTRLQFQKDYWTKVSKDNKASTLIDGLLQYCKVDQNDIQELSQYMFLWPQTFKLGNIKITQKETNRSNKYYLETVGLPNEELPMMKEIKTTSIKSAWLRKKTPVEGMTV